MDKPVAVASDDWGYEPRKGGMAIEARLGMFIIMILVGAFGFLVYRNVDLRQQELAAVEGKKTPDSTSVVQSDGAPGGTVNPLIRNDFDRQSEATEKLNKGSMADFDREITEFSFDDASTEEPERTDLPSHEPSIALDAGNRFEESMVGELPQETQTEPLDLAALDDREETADPFAFRGDVSSRSFDSNTPDQIHAEQSEGFGEVAVVEERGQLNTTGQSHGSTPVDRTDLDTTEDSEHVVSEFAGDRARDEQVDSFFSPEPAETGNLFSVAEDDGGSAADSVDERDWSTLTLNDDATSVVETVPPSEVEQEMPFDVDALEPNDAENLITGADDDGFSFAQTEASFDSPSDDEAEEHTASDDDFGFEIAIPDNDTQSQTDDLADRTVSEAPLFVHSVPVPVDDERSEVDPVLPADDDLVLQDAGPEESHVLRPVTPGQDQQLTPSTISRDDGKFSVPGFAYENRVITASAESEPCEVCEVQPGDNYWKISRRSYGTTRYFSALALYNHSRIRDPKKLRPGMKVLLPTAEVLEQKYPKLFRNPAPRERKPSGYFVKSNGTAAYRIGERDTLSQIAQKHLGRSSRWIQIYRLNRTVLTNPNRLKPGTVIILPDDATDVHMAP